jgi:hypothetical protein
MPLLQRDAKAAMTDRMGSTVPEEDEKDPPQATALHYGSSLPDIEFNP